MAPASGIDWESHARGYAGSQVAAAAAGWSMGESPSTGVFAEAGRLGLLGLRVPVSLGGQGGTFEDQARAYAAVAAADFGLAMSLVNTHNVALRLAESAPASITGRYMPLLLSGRMSACTALTEPGAGSDLGAIAATARRSGAGWVLEGEKTWVVNARHAGVAIVFVQTEPGSGVQGLAAFLVDLDARGVGRYALDTPFSQTSMGTGGFSLSGVEVSGEELLLPPGLAFRTIMAEINAARTYVAAMCCGMLDAAIATVAGYGARRHVFGKPLATHPAWRTILSDAEVALAAARALTDAAVKAVTSGADARVIAAEAKIACVEAGQLHLPALLHAMGAEGLRSDHCLSRHLGAFQVAALTDGATALLKDQVLRQARPRQQETEG